MPINKDALFRFLSIDIRIRRKPFPTLTNLTEFCNENLKELNNKNSVSQETIKKDLQNLNKIFSAPIIYDKELKAYTYSIKDYTLFRLSHTAVEDLFNSIKIKSLLETDKQFENKIQFETTTNTVNYSDIVLIYKAIKNKKHIQFTYLKTVSEPNSIVAFEPYLLKENRNTWYVIGKLLGKKEIRTYALHRMNGSIKLLLSSYSIDKSFNPKTYFKHSIGITTQFAVPEKVQLKFIPSQKRFLTEKPLHQSQQIIKDTDTEFIIELHVEPTYELQANILSYGANVKVLSPKSLIVSIKNHFQKSLENYSTR